VRDTWDNAICQVAILREEVAGNPCASLATDSL